MRALALAVGILIGIVAVPTAVEANTVYWPSGEFKTYQTYYESACNWYDERAGTGAPCYMAVWSNATAIGSAADPTDTMRIQSWAEHHDIACYGQVCQGLYSPVYPYPADYSATYYVSDYLVHYYPGNFSGGHKNNVIGWSRGTNSTKWVYGWVYTESRIYE